MHYTLQQRIADEGIVRGLFQGCNLTLLVSVSLALICTAGSPSEPALLYSLYSLYSEGGAANTPAAGGGK